MAYLSSFDYDIFISYAHVDNVVPRGARGWVERFQEELEIELSRRMGRVGAARIWWDKDLDGSQIFNDTIQQTISQSALFLALTSSGYLKSDYCMKELDWFCEKSGKESHGLIVGERARVFNILIDDVPYTSWPKKYGGSNGYPFYDKEVSRPLRFRMRAFERQLKALVDVVEKMLAEMKGGAPPQEDPFSIFIADTADSLKTLRSRVITEMQRSGVSILPRIPPPFDAQGHEEAASDRIKEADLCVHLLDHVPGREIEDRTQNSYLERQADLSLEIARSQFVWVPRDLRIEEVEDESHKSLLLKLEGKHAENRDLTSPDSRYRFVRNLPSAVTTDLNEQIALIKRERESRKIRSDARLAALVNSHFKDQQYVMELSRFLLEKQILPLINREEDSPQKNLESFENQLRQANLLIIVYGDVSREWVRGRLGEALKFAVTQDCPLQACGVYLAPPRKNQADMQFNRSFLPLELLDNSDCFNPQTLGPLLARIQVGV